MTFPPAPPERHARRLDGGLLRRRDRAERVGAVPRLLRRCRTAARCRTRRRSRRCPRAAASTRIFPMPFRGRVRVELTNGSSRSIELYYQIDYTLQRELPADVGLLHCAFRRENPTTMGRDFVIADGPEGPGRFLGCVVGVRVHRRRLVVRRGRGEGVPRRRHRPPDDLRHRARGLRRQRVGHGRAPRAVRGRAARGRTDGAPTARSRSRASRVRRLLPLARRRSDRVHRRAAGHDPADRDAHASRPAPARSSRRSRRRTRRPATAGCAACPGSRRSGSTSASTTTARPRSSTLREPQPVDRLDVDAARADLDRLAHERPDPMESWFDRSRRAFSPVPSERVMTERACDRVIARTWRSAGSRGSGSARPTASRSTRTRCSRWFRARPCPGPSRLRSRYARPAGGSTVPATR